MMDVFSTERGKIRLGVLGTVALVLVALVALNSTALATLFGARTYHAIFSEAGGINPDDLVFVSGLAVGSVRSVDLIDDRVEVSFEVTDRAVTVGDATRAAIKTQTALGKKALELSLDGQRELPSGGTIPLERTVAPYDITQALSQLTKNVTDTNTDQLAASLNAVAGVLDMAAPRVRPALDGVRRLSAVINSRDTQLAELLGHTAGVTGVLAQRSAQVQTLFADGNTLLAELNRRRDDLAELLRHVTDLAHQLSGLTEDNRRRLGPTLDELTRLQGLLRENTVNLDKILSTAAPTLRELGEVASSFPGLDTSIANLAPTNVAPILPRLLAGGGR